MFSNALTVYSCLHSHLHQMPTESQKNKESMINSSAAWICSRTPCLPKADGKIHVSLCLPDKSVCVCSKCLNSYKSVDVCLQGMCAIFDWYEASSSELNIPCYVTWVWGKKWWLAMLAWARQTNHVINNVSVLIAVCNSHVFCVGLQDLLYSFR